MKPIAIFTLCGSLLMGACTEREVLFTESNWTTFEDKAWDRPAMAGEKKKKGRLQQMFDQTTSAQRSLSDVVAGKEAASVDRPAFAGKQYDIQQFDGAKSYSQRDKKSPAQNQLFGGLRDFGREPFDSGAPARESQSVAPWANQSSDMPSRYATNQWTGSPGKFVRRPDRDASKLLPFFGGRSANESRSVVLRPEALYESNQAEQKQRQNKASMTVDEVRKLLHPGEYADKL